MIVHIFFFFYLGSLLGLWKCFWW